MSSRAIYSKLRGDQGIWLVTALLAVLSLLVVYSSTGTLAYKYQGGNTEFYLLKHGLLLGVGIVLMYSISGIHYMHFFKWAPILLLITIVLLFVTLGAGTSLNEAKRWIVLPVLDVSFQTSDLAKLTLIIYVARTLTAHQEHIKDFNRAFVPVIVPVLITCLLIAPADLSTALLLFLTCTILMFVGRMSVKYIGFMFLIGLSAVGLLALIGMIIPDFVRLGTWISRIQAFFMGTGDMYQVEQARIAIAEGGMLGLGPGNSIQRNFLPHSYSDFIYAIVVEEYGIVGGGLLLLLFVFLFFRIVRMVVKSQKTFGSLLVLGLGLIIILQALINMAVSVNLVPVTGLTLPLVSMGGTSILFTCISLGLILSVSHVLNQWEREQLVSIHAAEPKDADHGGEDTD